MSGAGGVGSGTDSKVETIARLAQWRIENFGTYSTRRSDAFKLGIWNWHLSVEKNRYLYIRLYPEPSRIAKEQPPFVKFVIRVSSSGPSRRPYVSPVLEKLLRTSDDFLWPVDTAIHGRFTIDVEFLDMKISPSNGGEMCTIWPNEVTMIDLANKSGLHCLSRMLEEEIYADVTIHTADGGALKAHKAVLSTSSPVFESMFLHDLNEKESSTILIEDLLLEDCAALLAYIYGTIKPEDFLSHRLSLLGAANKYDITELKDCCEESLLEDINSGNVLERLQAAWLYQLNKLKDGCLMYLFDFGKIYDLRDEIYSFFRDADRELMLEMFQQMMSVWRPA
ncbi:BTB/POZ domain-containing protein [Apostasia shenzhenica]|uniref:BTB/POZ domain-containing protein n=1 Tax=Apostasia shenzhenica TaxID=1088818 RepID=A0A2I0A845_9ASPA|nr:BTB/POZ domain-containing protein [Apostasia shenzhenica]